MSTTHWQVQLAGEARHLRFLEASFASGSVRVKRSEREIGQSVLEADCFLSLAAHEDVSKESARLASLLSGLLWLETGTSQLLSCGAVFRVRADGGRDVYVTLIESLNVSAEIDAIVVGLDGEPQRARPAQRKPAIADRLDLTRLDANAEKAMRLLGKGAASWVDLYRAYEVLEGDVGGQHELQRLPWVVEQDVRRFKHSANSVSVGGDSARHGRELNHPPGDPMSLEQAEQFVQRLVLAWLNHKSSSAA